MKDLEKLVEPFRTSIKQLIKKAEEKGIPVYVTETLRTMARQRQLVAEGKSKTMNSKHLIGEAADIAFLINNKLSYSKELYAKLYKITEDVPFVVWPFEDYKWGWDMPHHQYDKTKKVSYAEDMELKDCQKTVRELNTELGVTTEQRDECGKSIERIEDALGIPKTGDVNKILKAIGSLTEENSRVTSQRDEAKSEAQEAKGMLQKVRDAFVGLKDFFT